MNAPSRLRWCPSFSSPARGVRSPRSPRGLQLAASWLVACVLLLGAAVATAQPAGSAPAPSATVPTVAAAQASSEASAAVAVPGDTSAAPAPAPAPAAKKRKPPPLHEELLPILILVAVIALVVWRLPRVEIEHSSAFRRRRMLNWLPLGLTYAFLYMARYNIVVWKDVGGISQQDFGNIDAIGSLVYGVSFLLNGPLTDRWGGRVTILLSAGGALVVNVVIGIMIAGGHLGSSPVATLAVLYAANMYFQSFGAVSIVKVNSGWFHLRERGVFGGIFGILISLGIYFAFDWGLRIALALPPQWLFFVPAAVLALFWVLSFLFVRDHPSQAGFEDFDAGDASSGDTGPRLAAFAIIKRMLTNKIILIIAVIELCSGFLRQGILKWYRDFAKGIGIGDSFVYGHWGMVSCIAGITGGVFAGLISDHLFQSRRGPVSSVLYGIMVAGALLILALLGHPFMVSWIIAFMAMAIIGVHGMLSGVASQDFGGKKNAGTATGIIDGFVYLGTALQAVVFGNLLPEKGSEAAKQTDNWIAWPGAMLPMAILGLFFAVKIWNARANKPVAAKS